jgi:hypothetical protein
MTKYQSNMNTLTIVTTIAKYHSPTTLVTGTMVTKHYSHNIGHSHHDAKYQYITLVNLIMVPSINL